MKKSNTINELYRDIISFGSPIFFILVLVRVSMTKNYVYLSQFFVAGILFLILMFIFKSNIHSGLGIILLFFTSIFYNYLPFTIFATLIYASLIFSLINLKKDKKEINKGIVFGVMSTIISYYLVSYFNALFF